MHPILLGVGIYGELDSNFYFDSAKNFLKKKLPDVTRYHLKGFPNIAISSCLSKLLEHPRDGPKSVSYDFFSDRICRKIPTKF